MKKGIVVLALGLLLASCGGEKKTSVAGTPEIGDEQVEKSVESEDQPASHQDMQVIEKMDQAGKKADSISNHIDELVKDL